MVQLLKEVVSPLKISCETSVMIYDSDEHMILVKVFLRTSTLPSHLNMDDCVAIKRLSSQFVIQGNQFCRKLAQHFVAVVGSNEHAELLRQIPNKYNHCGPQKLLQVLIRTP